jgi:hypothetical protein
MTSKRALTALASLAALAALAVHPALAPAAVPPPASAPAAPTPPAAAGAGFHRIELPGGAGEPFPYTVEVPVDWQVHHLKDAPGIWLGPADAQPPDDPRLVYVRVSRVPLANPAETVASIKANDAADGSWSAPLVEVREVGGVKGILVQMDSGAGERARSTLTLKMPLPKTSVDFIGSSRQDQFARLRPAYERVLFSVRPVPPAPAGKP